MRRAVLAVAALAAAACSAAYRDERIDVAVRLVDTLPADAPESGALRIKSQAVSCVLRSVLRADRAEVPDGGPACPAVAP